MRISSFCFSPADSDETSSFSRTLKGMRSMNASSRGISVFQSMMAGASAREMTRFSAAVRQGTRVNCW